MKRKKRVLVVDDDLDDTALIVRIISSQDYFIRCSTGQNLVALEREIKKFEFSIIILDFFLGSCNGFKILEMARKINPMIKFVFVTGIAEFELLAKRLDRKGIEYNSHCFLSKKDLSSLLNKIEILTN